MSKLSDAWKQKESEAGGARSFLANASNKDIEFYTGLDGTRDEILAAGNALRHRQQQDKITSKNDTAPSITKQREFTEDPIGAVQDMWNKVSAATNIAPAVLSEALGFAINNPVSENKRSENEDINALANAFKVGAKDVYSGIARMGHNDAFADYLDATSMPQREYAPINLKSDLSNLKEYMTDRRGFLTGLGNIAGSSVALAPVGLAGAKTVGGWLANKLPFLPKPATSMIGYGVTKATPEALSEGGHTRADLLKKNPNNINPTVASLEAAALNYPTLVIGDMAEGLPFLKGFLNIPNSALGKYAANNVIRFGTKPLRMAPGAVIGGTIQAGQEPLQTAASNYAKGEDFGIIPDNWTAEQSNDFWSALIPSIAMGGLGNLGPTSNTNGAFNNKNSEQANSAAPTIDIRSGLEAGYNAWAGVTMDNGTNGCVEAVRKIGSHYSPWLANQSTDYAPTLVSNAQADGIAIIPFDPAQLQAGDVIVYDREGDSEGNDHVVIYDGNGGYVGNSSGRNKVVHDDSYELGGGLHPARIIKTGSADVGGFAGANTSNAEADTSDNISVDNSGVDDAFKGLQSMLDSMSSGKTINFTDGPFTKKEFNDTIREVASDIESTLTENEVLD